MAEIGKAAKPRQISPSLDAPQFCEDWLATARATGQLLSGRVMVRGDKTDKSGAPVINKRTGQPTQTWLPWR